LTTEDGEIRRLQLDHGQPEEVRRFYQQFAGQRVVVGFESSGRAAWFEELLEKLEKAAGQACYLPFVASKSPRLSSFWFSFKNTDHLWRQRFKRFGVALPNVLDEEMQLMLRCPGVRVVGWLPHSKRCLNQIPQVPGVARKISADCC